MHHDSGAEEALGIAFVPGQVRGDRERAGTLSPATMSNDDDHELN